MRTTQISPSLAHLSRFIPGFQRGGLEAGVFDYMENRAIKTKSKEKDPAKPKKLAETRVWDYKPYWEKLKDPRWQQKRLEILDRDGFKCMGCRSNHETLHVHHSHYRKGADPWDYENEDLVSLCENCHLEIEDNREKVLRYCFNNLQSSRDVLAISKLVSLEACSRGGDTRLDGRWQDASEAVISLADFVRSSEYSASSESENIGILQHAIDGLYRCKFTLEQ